MKQPELSLEFAPGDELWDGLRWHVVDKVNYSVQAVVTDTEVVSLWKALLWYARRDGVCVRNPWSKP